MKKTLIALATLGGGVSLAIVPAVSLISATKLFAIEQQGILSVAIMFATFIGQTSTAALIETKLATPNRQEGIRVPNYLVWLCVVTALVFFIWPSNIWLIVAGLPILFTSMESGRAAAVAERRDTREIYASSIITGTSLLTLVSAFAGIPQTFAFLACGVLIATFIRTYGVRADKISPSRHIFVWVIADVGITGAIFPLLNFVIISQLGAISAVAFAAVSTASGIVGIPLTFLRMRLLSEHSRFDVFISVFAVITAVIAIFIANWLGLFSQLFGKSWNEAASISALFIACLWRATSILTTIPFAKFRREGQAKLVTYVRLASSVYIFLISILVVKFDNLTLVFCALLTGEIIQWLAFEFLSRKKISK